jgi:hypothetical protein
MFQEDLLYYYINQNPEPHSEYIRSADHLQANGFKKVETLTNTNSKLHMAISLVICSFRDSLETIG